MTKKEFTKIYNRIIETDCSNDVEKMSKRLFDLYLISINKYNKLVEKNTLN